MQQRQVLLDHTTETSTVRQHNRDQHCYTMKKRPVLLDNTTETSTVRQDNRDQYC